MRRVLYILDMLSGIGGASHQHIGVLKHMDRSDIEAHFWCCQDGYLAQRLREARVPLVTEKLADALAFAPRNPLHVAQRILAYKQSLNHVRAYIKKNRIDLIHADYRCIPYASELGPSLGIPTVIHVRSEIYPETLMIKCLDKVDRVIVISHRLKDLLMQGGLSGEKAVVIHDGVDISRFKPKVSKHWNFYPEKRASGTIFVGLVGRIEPFKRQKEYLELALSLKNSGKNFHFFVIGTLRDERYFKEVMQFFSRNKMDSMVTFTGEVYGIEHILNNLDILVTLSGGSVVLEAMASGIPVVAAARPSPSGRSIIKDGVTGFLRGFDEVKELKKCLKTLADDPKLRKKMGAAARREAEEVFAMREVSRKTVALYDELIPVSRPLKKAA